MRRGLLYFLSALTSTLLVAVVAFLAGVAADRRGAIPGALSSQEPASESASFGPFWEVWNLIDKSYVERSQVDPTKERYGAIEGLLDSLGDVGHTRFLSPQDLKAEEDQLSGRLEGIGAEVGVRDGHPTIIAPLPGSPAERAGVRAGDFIVKVNGTDVSSLPLEQIVNMVRGPAGTTVTLTLIHRGETEQVDVQVTREQLTVSSVTWALVPGTHAAHVQVTQFAEHSGDEVAQALTEAQAQGATGYILDLRNDPGGIRDEAVKVASQFLSGGNVLLEQDAQGNRTPYPVQPGGVAQQGQLAVLVNEGTASSSEIVAGALQDYHRGPLVGATTFGTGTVLSTFRLSDGSAVLLGTSEWLTPDGRQIWHHGIAPDEPVALPSNVVALTPLEEKGMSPEDIQKTQDAQFSRALQDLQQSGS